MQEICVQSLGGEDSPREGNGNPVQYSCLGTPMDKRAWWATVHEIAKGQTWLRDWSHACLQNLILCFQFSSVQSLSHVWLFANLWIVSPTPGVYSNSCPLSQWCHPAISYSFIPFSSCPQSLPASGSFPMSQLFSSGGQSIGVSASASVLLMNTQDWSPLGWTGWISLQSKGLSRVFPNTTVFYWLSKLKQTTEKC